MSKDIYNNTIRIPTSSSDQITDGSTIGGDIIHNFKSIANIVRKTSDSDNSGTVVGTGIGNASYGAYSAIISGQNNTNHDENSAIIGGYNCDASIRDAIVTNSDRGMESAGGFSFVKSMTIPGSSTNGEANAACYIPSGGMAYLTIQAIDPANGQVQKANLMIYPSDSGYVYPDYWDSMYVSADFYYNGGTLYINNTGSGTIQIGIFGTIVGAANSYSGDSSW